MKGGGIILDGGTPLWMAARQLMTARVDEFFHRWDRLARSLDPETIHDLRVASRRLREGLELFAHSYPPEPLRKVSKGVKRVTRLLGELRNLDEAHAFFSSLEPEADADGRLFLRRFTLPYPKRRKEALAAIASGLEKVGRGDFSRRCRLLRSPAIFSGTPVEDLLAPADGFVRRSLEQPLPGLLGLFAEGEARSDIGTLHRLRIEVKHYRYRLEILSPFLPPSHAVLYADLKEYQEILGRLHDLDVFSSMMGEEMPDSLKSRMAAEWEARRSAFSAKLLAAPPVQFRSYLEKPA